jgi:hypothetical protein
MPKGNLPALCGKVEPEEQLSRRTGEQEMRLKEEKDVSGPPDARGLIIGPG